MAKILLLTPEKKTSKQIKETLRRNAYEVTSAEKANDIFKLTEKVRPDLILIDQQIANVKGKSICRDLREEYPELPIILIVSTELEGNIQQLCKAGADDFITKPIRTQDLLSRVNLRLGDRDSTSPILKVGNLTLNLNTYEVKRGKKRIQLTPQEYRLLKFMMRNKGRVLSREMILSRSWGYDADVQSRAVDVYIGYLRDKIDKGFKKKLIHTVRGFGYMIGE